MRMRIGLVVFAPHHYLAARAAAATADRGSREVERLAPAEASVAGKAQNADETDPAHQGNWPTARCARPASRSRDSTSPTPMCRARRGDGVLVRLSLIHI